MSNRLTFSLASLVLIFALAFATMPVMAAVPDSVTVSASRTADDQAWSLKVTVASELSNTDNITFTTNEKVGYQAVGGNPQTTTLDWQGDDTPVKPKEYTANVDGASAAVTVKLLNYEAFTIPDSGTTWAGQSIKLIKLDSITAPKYVGNPGGTADFVVTITFDASGGMPDEVAAGSVAISAVDKDDSGVSSPTVALVTKKGTYIWDLTFTHHNTVADGHVITVGLGSAYRAEADASAKINVDLTAPGVTVTSSDYPEGKTAHSAAFTVYISLDEAISKDNLTITASSDKVTIGTPVLAFPGNRTYSAQISPKSEALKADLKVTVEATDMAENKGKGEVTVKVDFAGDGTDPSDNTPPTVTITGAPTTAITAATTVTLAFNEALKEDPTVEGVPDGPTAKYTATVADATAANTYEVTITPAAASTLTANVDETPVTFTVSAMDASDNSLTTGNTFMVTLAARTAPPTAGSIAAVYDPATMTTTISSGSIGANGFVVIGIEDLPDLHELFTYYGVTITLDDGDTVDDKNSRTVVISEILWGYDDGELDVADKKKYQFIELYNTTGANIPLAGWKLVFDRGRSTTLRLKDIDQVSNRDRVGWDPKGKSGRIAGTTAVLPTNLAAPEEIKSMYRNINYYNIEVTHKANREELLKQIPDGNAGGSWIASERWTTDYWIHDSKGLVHIAGGTVRPGGTGVIGATSVSRSPFVINEIGNSAGGANDWIELRNITDDVQSLKNYQLSVVTDKDNKDNQSYNKDKHKDTHLFNFHDKDYEVGPYGVVVITSTHPKDSDLAVGIDLAGQPVRSIKNDPEFAGATQAAKDLREAKLNELLAEKQENQMLKGLQHLYLVKSFNIPDSGRMLFILRNNHEGKHLGTANQIVDVVGTLRINDNTIATNLWPLKATGAPHGNVIQDSGEEFSAGKVYVRKADPRKKQRLDLTHIYYNLSADGVPVGGIGENHISIAGYTGVGYDRHAADNGQNGGTPGYDNRSVVNQEDARDDNGKVIDPEISVHQGIVTISEIMLATHTAPDGADRTPRATRLPQWIEIYNAHMTKTVNLKQWYLEIRNSDSEDLITRHLYGRLRLPDMNIPPNQTVLIVSSSGLSSPNFPEHRVINLFIDKDYRDILSLENRNDPILSQVGFYIELRDSKDRFVDEVGNLPPTVRRSVEAPRATLNYTPVWKLPEMNHADGPRTSLIRIYNDGVPADGLLKVAELKTGMKDPNVGWRLASDTSFRNVPTLTYYGNQNDYGTPGYRGGGPLPVSLSKFRPERLKETGEVVIRWITESELNNAGFNIFRSETRNGEYTKLNTQLIAGQGTTSERNTYEWKDTSAKPNVVYYYQIQDVSLDGKVTPLRVSRLKGHVNAAGKATTTWGELKALQ